MNVAPEQRSVFIRVHPWPKSFSSLLLRERMPERGITLIEMLIVVTLIGLMAGISFPAVSSGVDSLRLSSAADTVVAFLNAALNRAERRQIVLEVSIFKKKGLLRMRSAEPGFLREIEMPPGVTITATHPEDLERVFLYPGGTVPRIGVELTNRRGMKKTVRVDPISGIPQIETASEK
jgi:prepilin-type N-terminal cleavage/methylation domain-containing protein